MANQAELTHINEVLRHIVDAENERQENLRALFELILDYIKEANTDKQNDLLEAINEKLNELTAENQESENLRKENLMRSLESMQCTLEHMAENHHHVDIWILEQLHELLERKEEDAKAAEELKEKIFEALEAKKHQQAELEHQAMHTSNHHLAEHSNEEHSPHPTLEPHHFDSESEH